MKIKATSKFVRVEGAQSGQPTDAPSEFRLHTILVPVDFSEASRKALHYAGTFARKFQAEMILLHVVEPASPPWMAAENAVVESEPNEEAAKQLAEWRQEAIVEAISPNAVKATVRSGMAYQEIVRAANENNADLIILGTQGRTGLAHFFLGSRAERVVQLAPCPVLVVREKEHDFLTRAGERMFAHRA